MSVPNPFDARESLEGAARAEHQTRAASRWFVRYLLVGGAYVFGWILLIQHFVPRTPGRYGAWAVGLLTAAAVQWWVRTHDVRPKVRRLLWTLMGASVGLFLLAYIPVVWLPGRASLAQWTIVAAAAALPFLVAAWREWRRS